jgi:hypothetical protein
MKNKQEINYNMGFRGEERENFEDGKITEKDGEIFQEKKKETKETRILLGKKNDLKEAVRHILVKNAGA